MAPAEKKEDNSILGILTRTALFSDPAMSTDLRRKKGL